MSDHPEFKIIAQTYGEAGFIIVSDEEASVFSIVHYKEGKAGGTYYPACIPKDDAMVFQFATRAAAEKGLEEYKRFIGRADESTTEKVNAFSVTPQTVEEMNAALLNFYPSMSTQTALDQWKQEVSDGKTQMGFASWSAEYEMRLNTSFENQNTIIFTVQFAVPACNDYRSITRFVEDIQDSLYDNEGWYGSFNLIGVQTVKDENADNFNLGSFSKAEAK